MKLPKVEQDLEEWQTATGCLIGAAEGRDSFRGPRYPPRFVSRSLRSRSRKVGGGPPGQGQCSTGDPIAGLLSRGCEQELPGSQAVHPVPLPRSATPAESTIPHLLTVSSMLPPLGRQ
jgi:hypothetical protein